MANHAAKAQEFMAQAEKKMAPKTGFLGGLLGGGNSFEEAAELYGKAANYYKMGKMWDKAGEAYWRAAEASAKAGSKHEAASTLTSAAHCYKKAEKVDGACKCFKKAVECYTDEGRFAMAAKYQKEIAELYESQMDLESAMEAFQTAADYYEGEGSSTSANQCLLKVAQFAAQLEQYDQATELFEQVGQSSLGNRLVMYSAKEYFFKACLSRLASGDVVAARKCLERYSEMDHMFAGARESRFLDQILQAMEEMNVDDFTDAVVEYDSISKLDNWKTTILLRIKNQIKEAEEDLA